MCWARPGCWTTRPVAKRVEAETLMSKLLLRRCVRVCALFFGCLGSIEVGIIVMVAPYCSYISLPYGSLVGKSLRLTLDPVLPARPS